MSSVSGISSYNVGSYTSAASGAQRRQRPDPAEMADDLFSKLDTSGKGYIEQSDLETALSTQSTTSGVSASDIFTQLDGDSDGKVTQDELSSGIQKLAEALDNQFNQARMEGAAPPPPPPKGDDTGFTKDELTAQLSEIGDSDSKRSTLISNIVENFDAADSDGDGKVSFVEAMAYDKARNTASNTASSTTADTASASTTGVTETTDAQIFRQIMELMRSYGGDDDGQSTLSSLLSVSA